MKSPEEIVRDAERVSQFLKDEAIADAMSRMERRFYEEFIASKTSEERVRSWAKANVLRDFEQELRVIISAGETEVLKAAKDAQKSAASRNPGAH